MPAPTWKLEVDWNGNGTFGEANENIIVYVLQQDGIHTRRGRDQASQLTGRSNAGTLTCRLNNNDGRFSSFNTSSPLSPNILPGRRVRLQATVGVATYTVWQGFLESVVPEVDAASFPTVVLRASGPLAWLNDIGRRASVAMATNILTGTEIGAVLDDPSWPAADRTIDAGQTTLARFWTDRVSALTALRKIEESESGFIRESNNGKFIFEDRHHRLKSPHTTSQATYSDGAGVAFPYVAITQEDPWSDVYNRFEAVVQLYTVDALAVLWTLAATGASSPTIPPGASRDFWASYPNPDSSRQSFAVDAWTTPVATTDFTANSAADGSGINLTASVSVAVSKFANAMKITLTNNHATLAAYITLLQARGTPVIASDPITIVAEDGTSQTAYGERTFPHPGEFVPTVGQAKDWADFNLSIYKDPIPRLAVTFASSKTNAIADEMLTRDVSDRITLVATSTKSRLGVNEDFFIESVEHSVVEGNHFFTTFELSPASDFGGFWTLGVSALGTGTKLAY